MPLFKYKGRNTRNEIMRGVLEAADSGALADQLLNTGITPIEIQPVDRNAIGGDGGMLASLRKRRIKLLDIMLFSRQMNTLVKAGVPLLKALSGMERSSRNPAFAAVVRDIRENLDKGYELSASMAKYPKLFNGFYTSMVKVGEMTGRLEEIFLRLAEHLAFEKKMGEQIKGALRYPAFVILAISAGMLILNIFVIPTFAKVFAGFNTELPLMTKVLIGVSNVTAKHWPILLAGAIAAGLAFRSWVGTQEGRYAWDRLKLRIPIAGKIIFMATMARFARSFSLASRSGVPLVQAFSVVAEVVDNKFIGQRIDQMRVGVERGESVLQTAMSSGVFSPIELQMIAVGEETGALDELMSEVADMYEGDVEYQVSTLSAQIEPILLLVLAAMVVTMALGIFIPMWDMGSAAMGKH